MIHDVNNQIAVRLEEVARILQEQRANQFRVDAYLRAAQTVRHLDRPVAEIVRTGGIDALKELPGVGETIARAIHQLVTSGRLPMLDRLRGESDPIALLTSVPGIGAVTAWRLHDELGIDSLEELEAAAHAGKLAHISGLGSKRIAGIIDSLAGRLGRVRNRPIDQTAGQPSVAEILDVDREYRTSAAKGTLPKIAPRRFNPKNEAWLPILHTTRGPRHYTAVFSNTARAHELGKTRDWVVIYCDGATGERQCTVVTAHSGLLEGRRVIRGREAETAAYYYPNAPGRVA